MSARPPVGEWENARRGASGEKKRQRPIEKEGDGYQYREWRRQLVEGCMHLDVDQIEWRFFNRELVPVAVIEITRYSESVEDTVAHNGSTQPKPGYFTAILQRFERDIQGRATRLLAEKLDVNAYIVLYRYDCSEFWVYNLTQAKGWEHFDEKRMLKFLRSRKPKSRDYPKGQLNLRFG